DDKWAPIQVVGLEVREGVAQRRAILRYQIIVAGVAEPPGRAGRRDVRGRAVHDRAERPLPYGRLRRAVLPAARPLDEPVGVGVGDVAVGVEVVGLDA